jgi:hypothetical protein
MSMTKLLCPGEIIVYYYSSSLGAAECGMPNEYDIWNQWVCVPRNPPTIGHAPDNKSHFYDEQISDYRLIRLIPFIGLIVQLLTTDPIPRLHPPGRHVPGETGVSQALHAPLHNLIGLKTETPAGYWCHAM